MSDLIKQAAAALDKKPVGMRGPDTQQEFLETINAAARALDKTALRQGSNQYSEVKAEEIIPEPVKTSNVREKLERVDIGDALISGAVEKLSKKSVIAP